MTVVESPKVFDTCSEGHLLGDSFSELLGGADGSGAWPTKAADLYD